ncbi:MAG: GWxTD domain-containing protein [Blastocatellia bacterium]|nr:GWxTD domain-containing protein [Blastocatellia bacterium]MCS7158623.1 GWxTD domain-containing protein [Blastocatellia bacterium]MCX7753531.1 GWxTD domain-containing protein [Blastocatellia bacterium]MDW8168198.1 GWxTD domain-containing protein [Acidobacteriota bacterium]MDW8257798.1 GWxTD domain-containing protein [Acidobacteriota bacterium]
MNGKHGIWRSHYSRRSQYMRSLVRMARGPLGATWLALLLLLSLLGGLVGFSAPEAKPRLQSQEKQEKKKKDDKERQRKRRTELSEVYKKWLEEDVRWIITEEERAAFLKLETDEEREQFIEQFWLRRDPNPDTEENEYREEHYRRIAYANERFSSGIPGWKTDRGRIYIMFGPPDSIESHPAGGTYDRPIWEGGGTTSTYPFEIWFYRYIEGVGSGIEIEFVDPTMTGEYRIARSPDEKDALLFVPGAGLTLAEQLGLASKADRPFFSPGNRERYPLMHQRVQDQPFERLQLLANLQRPPRVKFNDLATLADAKLEVEFDVLPFQMRVDFVRITDSSILTLITVLMENQDLSFKNEGGYNVATVNIHGRIRPVTGRRPQIFEDVVTQRYTDDVFDIGVKQKSIYQRQVTLPPGHYVIDLVIRDVNSGRTGVVHHGIQVPKYAEGQLSTSSLILAERIEPLHGRVAAGPFVLGNLKVRPNVNTIFRHGDPVGIYLQIYNPGVDQTTLRPAVDVEYILLRDGREVMRFKEDGQNGLTRFTTQQIVLARALSTETLPAGTYTLKVRITDHVAQRTIEPTATFTLTERKEN